MNDPPVAFSLVNGFGWAWVVLGDSRGAQRILAALDAAGDAAPARDRANALLLAGWIEASIGRLELARNHIAAATDLADTINDVDLQARCCYYLAYVVSHDGDFRQAIELTDRSDALYAGLDRPWDQAANWLFAARAAISADDEERSVDAVDHVQHWLRTVDDPWLHVRGEAVLGELARIQHRFDDAVVHLGRAAETSRRLGFLQTEAYQLSSLGRAQCQAGDYHAGAATLGLAIDKAEATGDVRLAALARVHLGRVLRALGQVAEARTALEAADAWHRAAGVANRPRSANACSPRWTRRIGNRAPRNVSSRSSTRPDSTTTLTSKSSPSTHWPAPPPKLVTSPRPATSVRRPIGAWKPPPTSSPTSTEPTPTRSGRSPERSAHRRQISTTERRAPLGVGGTTSSFVRRMFAALVDHDEDEQPAERDGDADELPATQRLAQQQERPHHRKSGLNYLDDRDRADHDRLLRVHQQPVGTPETTVISMYVHPVPLMPKTSPLAIASGSTATAAIGQIVAMKTATSMSWRKRRVDTT